MHQRVNQITLIAAILSVCAVSHPHRAQCQAIQDRSSYCITTLEGRALPLTVAENLYSIRLSDSSLSPDSLIRLHPNLSLAANGRPLGSGFSPYRLAPSPTNEFPLDTILSWPEVESAFPAFQIDGSQGTAWLTDEVIVTFSPPFSNVEIDSICDAMGFEYRDSGQDGVGNTVLVVPVSRERSALDVAKELATSGTPCHADANFVVVGNSLSYPNDTLYITGRQWYLRDFDYPEHDIDAEQAWGISLGSLRTTVAILDVGFQWTHSELQAVVKRDEWDVVGNDIGRVPWGPDDDASIKSYGTAFAHGTSVLGFISAERNNFNGLCGLAPKCTVMPVKIVDDALAGSAASLLSALRYADTSSNRPDIVAIQSAIPYNSNVEAVLESLYVHGVTTVCSFGNVPWQAAYPGYSRWVIGVTGTYRMDGFCNDLSHGDSLDMCAPGCLLYSLDLSGSGGVVPNLYACSPVTHDWEDYDCHFCGTSAAAPLVAGATALVLSTRPDFVSRVNRVALLRDVLYSSAEDTLVPGYDLPGWDHSYGWGRVNAYRALLAVSRGNPTGDLQYSLADVIETLHQTDLSLSPLIHKGLSDLNCDGVVNSTDVDLMIDIAFRDATLPDPCFEFDY